MLALPRLGEPELVEKFVTNVAPVQGEQRARTLSAMLLAIEQVADVRALTASW